MMKKDKLRKKLAQRGVKVSPEVALVNTIQNKTNELGNLFSHIKILMSVQKKDFTSNPTLVQKIRALTELAQAILNLEKQAQEQNITFTKQKDIRTSCTEVILFSSTMLEQK